MLLKYYVILPIWSMNAQSMVLNLYYVIYNARQMCFLRCYVFVTTDVIKCLSGYGQLNGLWCLFIDLFINYCYCNNGYFPS